MFDIVLWVFAVIGLLSVIKFLIGLLIHIGLYVTDYLSDYNCKYVGRIKQYYFGHTEFNDWHIIPTFSIHYDGINSGITFYWLKYSFEIVNDFLRERDIEAISKYRFQSEK